MYCGLCSEPCPTGSIHHTPEFEGADYSLESLVRRFVKAPTLAYKPKKAGEDDPVIKPILDRGMLTHRIADVQVSNRSVGRGAAAVVVGAVFVGLVRTALRATWVTREITPPAPTTYGVGNAFLTDFVLPFEIASLVLLVALIGAVMVSRKEVKG